MSDHATGGEEASGLQREWVAIAAQVRAELRKLVPLIPAMKPDEVHSLVDTMGDAQWLEMRAATMDKLIERELAKLFAD